MSCRTRRQQHQLPFRDLAVAMATLLACASMALAGGGAQPKAGAPIAGLTATEIDRFFVGRERFMHDFTAPEGLGPVFNKESCADCHVNPIGGSGSITVTRFGLADKGSYDELHSLGGPLLQVSAIAEECFETVPIEANVTTLRVTNSSMAFGLIEAIPDADILANADPDDLDADMISGRARMVEPVEDPGNLRVGRFGWKASVATVLTFSADAALNEIGITNRFFGDENAPNGDRNQLIICDTIPDPEDGPDGEGFDFIDRVTDFQRFLGPPPQTPRSGMSGEVIFGAIGCTKCHVAEWTTADVNGLEDALRNKVIRPYSDFLLHSMGLLGDGIEDSGSDGLELRTPTLWNLSTRDPMLHDGRAAGGSFADRVAGPGGAIWWHNVVASEAKTSGAAFFALNSLDQNKVIAFLASLGRLEFDADANGSINYADFLDFKTCFGARGVTPDDSCAIHDIDQDGTISFSDFQIFLTVYEATDRDCDGDRISDLTEILLGAADEDGDGIPDLCPACVGDLNGDGIVNGGDLGLLLSAWDTPGADLNGDNTTNGADLGLLLGAWGPCL